MPDPIKTAASLRRSAETLAGQIEYKRRPMYEGMNLTRKRAQEIDSARKEADRLEEIRHKLLALADAFESDAVPPILSGVTSRALAEELRYATRLPTADWAAKDRERLVRAGLDTDEKVSQAHDALAALGGEAPSEDPDQRRLRKLETEQRLRKEPGFFVTPPAVVERIHALAGICGGMRVLEPSAGLGNLLDPLQCLAVIDLKVIEWNTSRQEILRLKGYDVAGWDFMEHEGEYDRIIMNPPFEKLQDIDHVRHAYDCLGPGGRLVSVMSESPFFRSDRKAVDFRNWLEDVGGWSEKLAPDAFKSSGTGAQARLVVINRPGELPDRCHFAVPTFGVACREYHEIAPPPAPSPEPDPSPVLAIPPSSDKRNTRGQQLSLFGCS